VNLRRSEHHRTMWIYDHCLSTPNFSRKILSVRLRQSFFFFPYCAWFTPRTRRTPTFAFTVHRRFIAGQISASCAPGGFPPWKIYRRTFAWTGVQGVPIITFARTLFSDIALGRCAIRFQLARRATYRTLRYISENCNVIDWLSPISRIASTVNRKLLNSTYTFI